MVNLGDEVRDTLSGFRGVVVSKHLYLHGCVRFNVQPPVDKEGKLPDAVTFDEPQLEVVGTERKKKQPKAESTGGPSKYEDTGRAVPGR